MFDIIQTTAIAEGSQFIKLEVGRKEIYAALSAEGGGNIAIAQGLFPVLIIILF